MYFNSRKTRRERERVDQSMLEDNVDYPEGSIKDYMNLRRSNKDKCCLVVFCVYMLTLIFLMGLGFFFGHYANIGTTLDSDGETCSTVLSNFTSSISDSSINSTCSADCSSSPGYLAYLQKVCIQESDNPSFSSDLSAQIDIYSFKEAYSTMLFSNVGVLVFLIICVLLIRCCPKIIVFYIVLAFLIMLGFSFYVLKSIELRVEDKGIKEGSIFMADQKRMNGLAFVLLALYLVFFPVLLFAPRKIKTGIAILGDLDNYYELMYTMVIFTVLIAILAYCLLFLMAFLVLNFFTGGDPSTSVDSFFYLYNDIHLSNPAVLVLFFIGVYWLFATMISWHKHFVASSMLQWYFEDGGKLKPVTKGLKRAWNHLGSAALDALLAPVEWLMVLVYSLTKFDTEEDGENEHHEDCLCCSNCLFSLRTCFNRFYCRVNRTGFAAAVLTNQTFVDSCEMSAVAFAQNKHAFFNVGGSLDLFLTLFSILLFVFVNYLIVYERVFTSNYPSSISGMGLSMLLAASLGAVVGQILANMLSGPIDCLLFCFLIEKKNNSDFSERQVKKSLEDLLVNQGEDEEEVLELFEVKQGDE